MQQFDFDLFVIGAGSGGTRAARVAAQHGARVGIAEGANFGGTCVNRGCVPKKLMVYASRIPDAIKSGKAFGWDAPAASFDWHALINHKDTEIDRLESVYERNLHGAGVQTFSEHATLLDANTVRLRDSGQVVTAERILIATGAAPARPDFPGVELAITSDELFHLPEQPKRLLIVGGGYIAVEFAGVFAGLGSRVTQLVRGPALLRGFDDEIAETLREHLSLRGVDLVFDDRIEHLQRDGASLRVTTTGGRSFEVDTVLLSTGRRPNIEALGLEAAGVEINDKGAIVVGAGGRTNVASIFAIGDVTDRLNLTPVAIREGQAFSDRHYGGIESPEIDYALVPTAVFTTPEIGVVGMTEAQAREHYPRLRVRKTKFRSMAQAFAGSRDQVFFKVLVDEATDRVVGVHLLGEGVAEMIQFIAVALKANATWQDFRSTVALHPTIAEELVTLR
ncbi:glutathione-disulfide reductase [Roseateles sp. L2-2]|uniref:glutathione-disulfide reductase n=1 Tax=Roseateles sp. L2-2 TaxID=3422597 RepID=UPI003D35F86B